MNDRASRTEEDGAARAALESITGVASRMKGASNRSLLRPRDRVTDGSFTLQSSKEQPMDNMAWKRRLDKGKKRMKERCIAVALANTPAEVHTIHIANGLSGRASEDGAMAAPRPFTRKALYVFLHECGHFHLGHCSRKCYKSRHRREYEAEMWAHQKMREAGIPVPRAMTEIARLGVGFRIIRARRYGAKTIDPAALQFAKLDGDRMMLGKRRVVLIPL